MIGPLPLLLQRLAVEPPTFGGAEARRALGPALSLFVGRGLLREVVPAACAPCPECGPAHLGRVEYGRRGGAAVTEGYLVCPECGVSPVDPDDLRRWEVDAAG